MGSKSEQPAARLGDIGSNHGPWPPTPIIAGSGNVLVNSIPAARKGDAVLLHVIPNNPPHPRSIKEGSGSVLINGIPAARVSDAISCGGKVATGSGNVMIGDSPKLLAHETLEIPPIVFPNQAGKQGKGPKAEPHNTNSLSADAPVTYTPDPPTPSLSLNNQAFIDQNLDTITTKAQKLSPDEPANSDITELAEAMMTAAGVALSGNQILDEVGKSVIAASLQESISQKRVNPQAFDEARIILKKSRQQIASTGARQEKYTQDELKAIAEEGEITDKYIVRVIESKYLGGASREGYIGPPNESGAIKYWSTTFDQIEADDSDPRLVLPSIGIDYDLSCQYTMILVDKEQVANKEGSYAIVPNYENLSAFTKQELARNIPHPELIDETLTEETSAMYVEAYQAMESVKKGGAADTDIQNDYFNAKGFSSDEQKLFKNRAALHKAAGANEHYLGNGLTKNLNDTDGTKPYAVVETFSYDKNPETIHNMLSSDNPKVAIIHLREISGIAL